MRTLLLLLLILISSKLYCQETYNGSIKGKDSKDPLAYVNIGIVGKNIGTVSNVNGDFKIELDKKYDEDTLRFSMIGYKPLIFKVSNFKEEIFEKSVLLLEQEITELKEIVVSTSKLKEKVIGNKTTSKSIMGGFTSNELGNEIGIIIKIKKEPTYIKDFNVSIAESKHDSLKFRLNFYNLKDGLPNKPILKENIIVQTQIKEGILTVDLSNYNIVVSEDFFVSLEWIENLGESDLYFSAGLFGNPIIVRETSQGDWEKIGGISLGFNVTAKY